MRGDPLSDPGRFRLDEIEWLLVDIKQAMGFYMLEH